MSTKGSKIGWIGAGRMGFEMARRLAKGGCDLAVWNRTRAKAEPLAKDGAKIVDNLKDLAGCDIVFCMVSTYDDVKEVIAGPKGLLSGSAKPRMVVECSSISLEGSADLREILSAKGVELLSAPVSGNAKVIKAGKLTFVVSGPKAAYDDPVWHSRGVEPTKRYLEAGRLVVDAWLMTNEWPLGRDCYEFRAQAGSVTARKLASGTCLTPH